MKYTFGINDYLTEKTMNKDITEEVGEQFRKVNLKECLYDMESNTWWEKKNSEFLEKPRRLDGIELVLGVALILMAGVCIGALAVNWAINSI